MASAKESTDFLRLRDQNTTELPDSAELVPQLREESCICWGWEEGAEGCRGRVGG